jgi:hypothetical protein
MSQVEFDASQVANQPRLPWGWQASGKSAAPYTPVITGKWWSQTAEQMEALGPKRNDFGHIGRIMETELGEKLVGDARCTACRQLDQECWVYSAKGRQQVSHPGSTCARCRVAGRAGGCSLSTRKSSQDPRGPPPPPGPPRPLLPRPPSPGAGGSGIAA